MSELKMGIYRHYKGSLYQVIGLAHDANAEDLDAFITRRVNDTEVAGDNALYLKEVWGHAGLSDGGRRTVVVYMPLQLNGAHLGPRMAVRTLEDFTAIVCKNAECPDYGAATNCLRQHHHIGPRFTYLGPILTEEMV